MHPAKLSSARYQARSGLKGIAASPCPRAAQLLWANSTIMPRSQGLALHPDGLATHMQQVVWCECRLLRRCTCIRTVHNM